jgi:hypothetical protein
MTYSISGIASLGTVQNEEQTKDAQLFQMALPRNDSNNTIVLDLFGVNKTIRINGVYTGNQAALQSFVADLHALAAGTQTTKSYVSDIVPGPTKVMVQSTNFKYEEGAPTIIRWEIIMIEAAQVT